MKPGDRVELLVAVNSGAHWFPAKIEAPSVEHPGCWNVRLISGRLIDACHLDSMRVVVTDEQRDVMRIGGDHTS